MNHKLFYTIEAILADLSQLICHNKNLSPEIVKFYLDLRGMHDNSEFDFYMQHYEELTADVLAEELYDDFQDKLEIYFDDLYKEALEKYA